MNNNLCKSVDNNPCSLSGKTILVTGASSGIGRAIAVECSKMGATVVITARNRERLDETLSLMEGSGHSVIEADLSKKKDREQLVALSPQVEGLVNCAGLIKTLPFQFITDEALEQVMSVNFTAPALISAQLAKKKKISKSGSIVFISSISGSVCVWGGNSIYSASKSAISGIAKNMAYDLSPKGIRVNCIMPGMVDTHIFDSGTITSEQLEEEIKRYPLRRWGKPEDVAYAAIYLLSDASSWVTGSNLVIDGGFTLL
jgi:NAD(P)-dependent dehydrogenase (short-subunit alcohol dehydrogenase family)